MTCAFIGPLLGSFYWFRKGRSPTKTWYETTTCWSILIEVGTNVQLNVLIEMRTDRVIFSLNIICWLVFKNVRSAMILSSNALLTSALERQHRWVINFAPGVFCSWLVEGGARPSQVWHDLTVYHNLQYSPDNQLVC